MWLGASSLSAYGGEQPVGGLVTGIEPTRHDVTGGSRLNIFGSDTWGGFQPGYQVEVNGVALTDIRILSLTSITGLVPANPAGAYDLVLRDEGGALLDSLPAAVEYVVEPLPPLEDVSVTRLDDLRARLKWSNPTRNDRIRIRRNGSTVGEVAGDSTEYTDTLPSPPTSAVLYELVAEAGIRSSTPASIRYLPWRDECLPILGTGGSGRASGLWVPLVTGVTDELQMCFHLDDPAPALMFQVYSVKLRQAGSLKCRIRSIDPPHNVLGPAYDGIVVEEFELFRESYTEALLPSPLAAGDYIVGFYSDGVALNQWSFELQADGDPENPGQPCPPPFYPMLRITPLCNNLPPTVLGITAEPPIVDEALDPDRLPFGQEPAPDLAFTLTANAADFDGAIVSYGWVISYACDRQQGEDEESCLERCRQRNDCLDALNSAGNSVFYPFPFPGSWTVGVTATDNAGATAFAARTIYVDVFDVPPACGQPPIINARLDPDVEDEFYHVRCIPDINDSLGEVNQAYGVRVTPSNCAAVRSVDLLMIDPVNGVEYPPSAAAAIVPESVDLATGAARYEASFNMSDLGYRDRFTLRATAVDADGRETSREWPIPMCVLPLIFDSDHNDVPFVDTTIEYDSGSNRYDIAARFPDGPVLDLPIDLDDLGIHLDNTVDAYLGFNEFLDDEFWHPQSLKGKLHATLLSFDLFDRDFEVPIDGPVAYGCDDYEIQYHVNNIDIYSQDFSWEVFDTTLWEGFVGPVHVRVRGSLDVGMGVDVTLREVRLIVRTVQEAGDPVVEIGVILVPAIEAWAEGEIRVEVFFGLASASVLLRPTVGIEFPINLQGALPPIALNISVDDCFQLKLDVKIRACADLPFFDEECLSTAWLNIFDEQFGTGCAAETAEMPAMAELQSVVQQDQPSDLKYPSIAVAPNGTTTMAVFVDDTDPDPAAYQPELFFALDAGAGFAAPAPIYLAGDAYTQRDTSVVFLNNAQALAVWTQGRLTRDAVAALPQTTAGANTGFKNQDIAYALWDPDGGWGPMQMLTNDAAPAARMPDGKPVAAAIPGDNAAWVLWVRSDQEDFFAGTGNANLRSLSIFARKIDNGVPGLMSRVTADDSANPAADIQPAVAVSPSGNVALAVWVRDDDGDFDTSRDRRLMYSVNLGAAWTAPVTMTNPATHPGVLMPSAALSSDDDGFIAFTIREVSGSGQVAGEGNKDLIYTARIINTVVQTPVPLQRPAEKRGRRTFDGVYGRDPLVRFLDPTHAALVFRSFDGFGRTGGDGEMGVSVIDLSQPDPEWTLARDLTDDTYRDWDIAAGVGPSCIRTVRDTKNPSALPAFHGLLFQDIEPKPDVSVDRIRLSEPHAPAGSTVTATVLVRNAGLATSTQSAPAVLHLGSVEPDGFHEWIERRFLFNAAPDETQLFPVSFVMPEELTRLRAFVDPIPAEPNTANNLAETLVGVLPPSGLVCASVPGDIRPRVALRWNNAEPYEHLMLYCDGRLISELSGDLESFFDRTTGPGPHTWTIRAVIGLARSGETGATCTLDVPLPGDHDGDGDVDAADFASLARDCLSGPQNAYATGCAAFDIDADADVDLRDVALHYAAATEVGSLNLLRNAGFEAVPAPWTGQGFLPSEWVVVSPSPDTYSNDGSFGLRPHDYGNFTGVTAHQGLRWIAGWDGLPESFGQRLTAPLTPDGAYVLTAWLHQAVRPDINHPGAYEILLATDGALASGVSLGRFANTTNAGWEHRTLAFTAPPDAEARLWLLFRPVATPGFWAYPGLDSVRLVAGSK